MKKGLLLSSIILSSILFAGCNFLNGSDLKQKMEEKISYSNAEEVSVNVYVEAQYGTIKQKVETCKVGYSFVVEFTPNKSATFLGWTAYDKNENPVTDDSIIEFQDRSSLLTTVTVKKSISSIELIPECGERISLNSTEPGIYEKDVMRTTPIKIRFSKPLDENQFKNGNYKNLISISRADNSDSLESETDALEKYFGEPVLKNENYQLWIPCINKLSKDKWMKAGSYVVVKVSGEIKDNTGVPLNEDYVFNFTLGTFGDSEGPIINNVEFKNYSSAENSKTICESVFGDWEPSHFASNTKHYADRECRVGKKTDFEQFSLSVTADDSSTGDTGVSAISVIQRLVYIPKGGYLPGTNDDVAASDLILFESGKNKWNYLSGTLKTDFEKEHLFKDVSQLTDEKFNFEDFTTNTGKTVDGIYMFEVTAIDGLGNYSSNPQYYYIVRDTTSPDVKVNAAKVNFSNDYGVTVAGKKYFGNKHNTIQVEIENKTLIDAGTGQGRPWCSSKPSEMRYKIGFTNNAEYEDDLITYWNPDWISGEEKCSIEIPEALLEKSGKYYLLFQVKDGVGNESAEVELLEDRSFIVDASLPEIDIDEEESGVVLVQESEGVTAFIIESAKTQTNLMFFNNSIDEYYSGIKEVYIGESAESLTKYSLEDLLTSGITVYKDKEYTFKIISNVDEKTIITLKIDTNPSTTGSYLSITNSQAVTTNYKLANDMNFYYYPRKNSSYKTKKYQCLEGEKTKSTAYKKLLTNGGLTVSFKVSSNALGLKKDGIYFDDFYITSYSVEQGKETYSQSFDIESKVKSIPLTRDKTKGDIKVTVTGHIDDSKFTDGWDKYLYFHVENGLYKRNSSVKFHLDREAPHVNVVYAEGQLDEGKKYVDSYYVGEDGNYYIDFYGNGTMNPYFEVWDEETSHSFIKCEDLTYPMSGIYYVDETAGVVYNGDYSGYMKDFTEGTKRFEIYDCVGNTKTIYINFKSYDDTISIKTDTEICDKTENGYNCYYLKTNKEGVTFTANDVIPISSMIVKNVTDNKTTLVDGNSVLLKDTQSALSSGTTYEITASNLYGKSVTKQYVVYEDSDDMTCKITMATLKSLTSSDYNPFYAPTTYSYLPTKTSKFYVTASKSLTGFAENGIEMIYTIKKGSSYMKKISALSIPSGLTSVTDNSDYYALIGDATIDPITPLIIKCTDRYGNVKYIENTIPFDRKPPVISSVTVDNYVYYESEQNGDNYFINSLKSGTVQYTLNVKDNESFVAKTWLNSTASNELFTQYTGTYNQNVQLTESDKSITRKYIMSDGLGNMNDTKEFPAPLVTIRKVPMHKIYSDTTFPNNQCDLNEWSEDSTVINDSVYSLKSSNTTNSSTSTLKLHTARTKIKFKYKVSSEENYDKFILKIDDTAVLTKSGTIDWTEYSNQALGSGPHTIEFIYSKDGSNSSGSDCVWIDDVIIEP